MVALTKVDVNTDVTNMCSNSCTTLGSDPLHKVRTLCDPFSDNPVFYVMELNGETPLNLYIATDEGDDDLNYLIGKILKGTLDD